MENFQKYDETQYTKSLQKYFLSWIALTYTQLLREGQTECNFAESRGRGGRDIMRIRIQKMFSNEINEMDFCFIF